MLAKKGSKLKDGKRRWHEERARERNEWCSQKGVLYQEALS